MDNQKPVPVSPVIESTPPTLNYTGNESKSNFPTALKGFVFEGIVILILLAIPVILNYFNVLPLSKNIRALSSRRTKRIKILPQRLQIYLLQYQHPHLILIRYQTYQILLL